jgi:hypothetical protein
VFNTKHSLYRSYKGAKPFYATHSAMIAVGAAIVLIPGAPLGLLTSDGHHHANEGRGGPEWGRCPAWWTWDIRLLLAWMLHLPPSAVPLVSDVRFCRFA